MSDVVTTYDPARVTVIIGGIPISGYADGTFLTVEPMSDAVMSEAGADGEIARAISSDKRYTFTLTLQQGSTSNDALSGLFLLDQASNGGGMVPIAVADLSGRTLFAVSRAWITKMPTVEFGKELNDREWVFTTAKPSAFFAGGNG